MPDGAISGRSSDPLMKFRFRVFIPDFEQMGFTSVGNLRSEVPVLEVEEGGNQIPYKFPDRKVNFGNVLMSTGLGRRRDLRIWFEEHMRWKFGHQAPIYRTILVTILNERMRPAIAWELFNAWPTIMEIDGLNAASDDITIQRIELANWGVARRYVADPGEQYSGAPVTLQAGTFYG